MSNPRPRALAASLPVWLCLCTASASGQFVQWQQLPAQAGPESRRNMGLAWDEARQRAVLFGGRYNPLYVRNDTWEWDGTAWTNLLGYGPLLTGFATVYDPVRRRVGIHGGFDDEGNNSPYYHEWDGSSWSLRALPQGNLPARAWHALAFDSVRQRLVLFGGWDGFNVRNDTWEVVGSQWVQRTAAVSPPARQTMAMSCDAARARVVLFGGLGTSGQLGDTWTWDGTQWTQHATLPAPAPRSSHVMTWDGARQRIVLHGGWNGAWLHDTWDWDGTAWSDRTPASGPTAGDWPAMTWDPVRERALLMPGGPGLQPAPLWEFGPVHPAAFTRHAPGCPGSAGVATLGRDTGPWLGSVLQVGLRQAPAGAPAALVLGLSRTQWLGQPLPLDLGPAGMPGCRLAASIDLLLPLSGGAPTGIPVPADPTLLGQSVYLQAMVGDPAANAAGLVWSDAFDARVGAR